MRRAIYANGVRYTSIADAARDLHLTLWKLQKRIESVVGNEFEYEGVEFSFHFQPDEGTRMLLAPRGATQRLMDEVIALRMELREALTLIEEQGHKITAMEKIVRPKRKDVD